MKGRGRIFFLLFLLGLALYPQYKPWYNHYNFSYGTKAMSLGNAFTAVADDLTAVFWNPAGLAAMRRPEFLFAYQAEKQRLAYETQEKTIRSNVVRYDFDFSSKLQQIDFFSISAPVEFWKMKWGFALSYYRYIPYGFKGSASETLNFSQDPLQPVAATVNFKGSEGVDVLAVTAAAAITEYAALGCTLQQFFSSGSLLLQTVGPVGEFQQQYTESMRGRNFIIGAMFRPFKTLNLGFTYHSGLKSSFDSQLLVWLVDEEGNDLDPFVQASLSRVRIPAQYSLGVSWRPAAGLNLSCDYSVLDWRDGTIENYYSEGSVLPYPQKNYFDTQQQYVRNLRLGMEVSVPLRRILLQLRGGWSNERQLVADRSGEPLRTSGLAAGVGLEFSDALHAEIAYQRQKADWLEDGYFVKNQAVPSRFSADLLKFSLTYRFGRIFKE